MLGRYAGRQYFGGNGGPGPVEYNSENWDALFDKVVPYYDEITGKK